MFDSDKVTGTNPAANSVVQSGAEVDLLTGSSGDQFTMPNLIGKRQEQAESQLSNLGVKKISVKKEPVSSSSDQGRVLDQSPQAGDQVSANQQIVLTVGESSGSGLVN